MGYLSVLAKLDAEQKRAFGAIATVTRLDLAAFEKVDMVLTWLDAHEPKVVVFDAGLVHAEKICRKVRSKKNLSSVPIIALVAEPTDALVERLYAQGADDVIPSALGVHLIERVKALPDKSQLTDASHGMAVVADKDHSRCDVIGRVLMNAGYDVKFALDDVALRYYTQQNEPRLVVLSAELGDARKFVEEGRKRNADTAWVVMSSRRDVVKHAETLSGIEHLSVVVNTTAPENVLFTSNELLRQGGPPSREDERVLYGTMVAYKPAGGEHEDVGFSYNISQKGLYVRTLSPPAENEVWLELRPPRGKRRVRLEGRVAWRRKYDPGSRAPVPPGFGVALTDGLGPSLELWNERVGTFVRSTRRGPAAVARLLDEALGDVRASQPDQESDSHIAAISVSSPSVSIDVAHGPAVAKQSAPVRSEQSKPEPPPTLESIADLDDAVVPSGRELETRRAPSLTDMQQVEVPAAPKPAALEPLTPAFAAAENPTLLAADRAPASPAAAAAAGGRRFSPVLGVALVLLLLGVAGAALFALGIGPFARAGAGVHTASNPTLLPPRAPPPTRPSAESAAVSAPPPVSAAPSAAASAAPPAAPDADAAVAMDASSQTGAAALPAVDTAGGGDGSELAWDEGYLVVRSSAAVDVYATGFKVGPTNRQNKARCGLRFVRLGENEPPSWRSKGKTVDVKCKAITQLEIAPE